MYIAGGQFISLGRRKQNILDSDKLDVQAIERHYKLLINMFSYQVNNAY